MYTYYAHKGEKIKGGTIMDEFAKNEPPISAKELLEEIFPLLKEHFEGKMVCTGRAINYIMPNGQEFIITARRIS